MSVDNKKEEWRAYFFNNFYISGIRNGIQAGHAADIMQFKYISLAYEQLKLHMEGEASNIPDLTLADTVVEWQRNHLTYIVLNGGDSQNMGKLSGLLERKDNPFPFAKFKESGASNLLTSMCILLPERIFSREAQSFILANTTYDKTLKRYIRTPLEDARKLASFTDWEIEFINEMVKCPTAD